PSRALSEESRKNFARWRKGRLEYHGIPRETRRLRKTARPGSTLPREKPDRRRERSRRIAGGRIPYPTSPVQRSPGHHHPGGIVMSTPMPLNIAPASLKPLIASVVEEVLARSQRDNSGLPPDRLAWSEAEAAALLGLAVHVLRDERRRGRIRASQVV